jgi:hypothetical protein
MIETRAHHTLPKSHGTWTWRMWLTTPKSSFRRPAQTRSASAPGVAYGTTRIERYTRCRRIPFLSSVIARKSPTANEMSTVSVANASVQANTRRNGLRTSGLWTIAEKFRVPTLVVQPGSSSAPVDDTNEPLPLSW